jgi:hypothetical protein
MFLVFNSPEQNIARVGSKFHTSQKRSPRQLHDVTRKSELKAGNTSTFLFMAPSWKMKLI